MNELALFAGAGGGLLATKHLLGWRTVCYVENAKYPVRVLKARIQDGLLDDAPIWDDARTFDGTPWCGVVDCITAGFPCQPFSQAGKGLAERDDRNLWPDTIRIVREVRPEWILLENVPRLLSHTYVRQIFGDLAESGYSCRWDCVSASAVGANHQRDRLWIVAHANDRLSERAQKTICTGGFIAELRHKEVAHSTITGERGLSIRRLGQRQEEKAVNFGRDGEALADSDCKRLAQWQTKNILCDLESAQRQSWWGVEPNVGRVVDGCANRMDRVAAIGNMQVPAVVATVWRLLSVGFSGLG